MADEAYALGGPTPAESYLVHREDPRRGGRLRRGRRPPRLRFPGRERRLRAGGPRRRADLDRPPAGRDRGPGRQGGRPAHRRSGRRPHGRGHGRPGQRGRRGRRVRVPARPAHRHQGGVRWWRPGPQGGPRRGRDHRGVRVRGPRGRRGVRARRVLRRALPGPAPARGDPVPRRRPRERGGDLDPRLLAAAPAPEAGRGGTRAVPVPQPGRAAVPGVEGHPPGKARLRGRGDLRVPRRAGRHGLVPRGQHPAPGRAPGVGGGHRHRPGPGDVPHRGRAGTRLRRPAAARALDRVPGQRRGPRPELPARPRHDHRAHLAVRPGGAGGRRATRRA